MRAVIYARVSSALQRDRETIASQLRVLPEFVARVGWELVAPANTYVDDGRTAKAGQLERRTGLALLLHDAALGMFDVVVVVDVDRITRSEDLAERGAILGALQRAGVKVASSTSGQVLDLSTSTGDLFTTLHAFFAAEWTRKHRERVTQGKITAIQRGRKPSGPCPWGLAFDRASGRWQLDAARAQLVREIFERVAGGESCRAIADDLNRRGIVRPRGKLWSHTIVARTIRARYPLGEWTADKTRNLKIAVPAIIDADLWQRANEALDEHGQRGLRKTRHEYLLEGLAVCGDCGAPIGIRSRVYDPRHNGRFSPAMYRCRGRIDHRFGGACAMPLARVDDADRRVWAQVAIELASPELAEEIERELAGGTAEQGAWQADADGYRKHLVRLERVQTGVLERWRRGLITDTGFDAELERIRAEREMVERQLAGAEDAARAGASTAARLADARQVLDDLRACLDDPAFTVRRHLVELLVPRGGIVMGRDRIRVIMLVPKSSRARSAGPRSLVDATVSELRHETHVRIRLVA